jgi:hypothetical protein
MSPSTSGEVARADRDDVGATSPLLKDSSSNSCLARTLMGQAVDSQ